MRESSYKYRDEFGEAVMKSIYHFGIFLLCLRGVLAAEGLGSCGIPSEVEYFLNRFGEEQEQKNKSLVLVAKNVEGECGIEKIGLLFDYYDTFDLSKARHLVVSIVEDLLREVNSQEKLRPFFAECSLTINDVVVRIRHQKGCEFVFPALGNIVYITAIDGLILYGTLNSYTLEIDNLRTEPYSQALKMVSPT